jgi:hypothetical protein
MVEQCFIVTYCEAKKTGAATSVLVRISLSVFAAITLVIPRLRNMERHGFSSIVKALPVAPKQRGASDITRPDEVEISSIGYCRAVAAATGRGFKSDQPDFIIANPKL